MPLDLDLAPYCGHVAGLVNQKGGTLDSFDHFTIHVLVFDHIISCADDTFRIGQQWEGQPFQLENELFVRFQIVATDPQHFGVQSCQFGVDLAKLASFVRSTRGVVFGIKVQYYLFFAPEVRQANLTAGARQGKIGRQNAGLNSPNVLSSFRIFYPGRFYESTH